MTKLARAHLVRLLIALPAIAGAGAVVVLESARLRPAARAAWETPAATFGDALRNGDLHSAFLLIRSGQDVHAPVPFRDTTLTGGREMRVTPLLIAVAGNKNDALMMLMSFGARLDTPGNQFAACLAGRLGHDGIARLIERYGGPAASEAVCPDATPDPSAPLLAFGSAAP